MEVKRLSACQLAEDDVTSWSPPTIFEELPITAAHFEINSSGRDRFDQGFPTWFPASQEANGTIPLRISGRERAMAFVAVAKRHVKHRLAE